MTAPLPSSPSAPSRLAAALAALYAALGVAGSAAGAHVAGGELLRTAADLLLAEAGLLLAAAAAVHAGLLGGRLAGAGLAAGALGAALFAADLGLRVVLDHRLFPMAAPTGGTLLIAGWLVVSVAALLPRGRPRS